MLLSSFEFKSVPTQNFMFMFKWKFAISNGNFEFKHEISNFFFLSGFVGIVFVFLVKGIPQKKYIFSLFSFKLEICISNFWVWIIYLILNWFFFLGKRNAFLIKNSYFEFTYNISLDCLTYQVSILLFSNGSGWNGDEQ